MRWRLVVILLLCLPGPILAQVAITGKISGVVTDPSGAAISGATVRAKGEALLSPVSVPTQADGTFLVVQLPPGTYEVTCSTPGFKTWVQKGITVSSDFNATLRITLEVGELNQTVTVEGQEPVVDVKSGAAPTTFDTNLLQNLPNGRDPWSTVTMAPGATSSTFDVGGSQSYQQSSMSIHGSRPGEHVYSFNGLKLNWPGSSGGFTAFYIDYDSLQEFQLVTDAAPAEVGVGGAYMNMVTKSGSNQLHGMAAGYYLTSAMQAGLKLPTFKGQPVNAGSPFAMSRDTTVNGGWPVLKNRWWMFGAYRRYDIRLNVLAVRRRDGTPIFDNNHQSNLIFRNDFQVGPKDRVNLQWLYNEQNRFFRRSTAYQFVNDEAAARQIEPAYILQAQWTRSFTPNLVMDLRFGYLHLLFPLSYQPTVGPNDLSVADLTLSTLKGAAPNNFLNPATTSRFAASGSYYKGGVLGGAHNFKFGYEYGVGHNGNFFDINGDINVFFNNGVPLQVQIFNTPVREQSAFHETSFFLQDSWSLGRKLTLNLGFRFDRFRTFNPEQCSPAPKIYGSFFPTRCFQQSPDLALWNSVVPRLSVAFDPTGRGRSVIRAGFSRFNLIEGTRLAEAVNPNILGGRTYRWNDLNGDGIPQPNEFLTPENFLGAFGGIVTRVDPNVTWPHSDQWNVGYEQQLFRDVRVGVSYYYRTHKKLLGRRNVAAQRSDYTPITLLGGAPIVNPLTGQPLTLYNLNPDNVGKVDFLIGTATELDDNAYHGVEFTAVKRFTSRWQLLAGFTIQRSEGTFGSGLGDDFNNPNLDINRKGARLDQDSTYVLKLDGTYRWPYGFTTSVNFQHYTGYPLLPRNVFRGLNQNSENVILAPRGAARLDNVNEVNLRITRPFSVRERVKIEPVADLLNLFNSNAVLSRVEAFGPNYLRPGAQVLNPFVARFGLKLLF